MRCALRALVLAILCCLALPPAAGAGPGAGNATQFVETAAQWATPAPAPVGTNASGGGPAVGPAASATPGPAPESATSVRMVVVLPYTQEEFHKAVQDKFATAVLMAVSDNSVTIVESMRQNLIFNAVQDVIVRRRFGTGRARERARGNPTARAKRGGVYVDFSIWMRSRAAARELLQSDKLSKASIDDELLRIGLRTIQAVAVEPHVDDALSDALIVQTTPAPHTAIPQAQRIGQGVSWTASAVLFVSAMCYLESSVYWSDPGHLGGAGVSLAWSLLAFVDQVHFMSILGRVSDDTALLAFSEKLSWINYDFTTLSLEDGAEETSEPLAAESCGVSITVGFLQRILTCLALNLSAVAVASFYTWRSRRKNRALRKELGSGVEEGVKATAVEDGTAPGVKLENMDEKDKDMSWSEMSHSMSVWAAPLLLSQVFCVADVTVGIFRASCSTLWIIAAWSVFMIFPLAFLISAPYLVFRSLSSGDLRYIRFAKRERTFNFWVSTITHASTWSLKIDAAIELNVTSRFKGEWQADSKKKILWGLVATSDPPVAAQRTLCCFVLWMVLKKIGAALVLNTLGNRLTKVVLFVAVCGIDGVVSFFLRPHRDQMQDLWVMLNSAANVLSLILSVFGAQIISATLMTIIFGLDSLCVLINPVIIWRARTKHLELKELKEHERQAELELQAEAGDPLLKLNNTVNSCDLVLVGQRSMDADAKERLAYQVVDPWTEKAYERAAQTARDVVMSKASAARSMTSSTKRQKALKVISNEESTVQVRGSDAWWRQQFEQHADQIKWDREGENVHLPPSLRQTLKEQSAQPATLAAEKSLPGKQSRPGAVSKLKSHISPDAKPTKDPIVSLLSSPNVMASEAVLRSLLRRDMPSKMDTAIPLQNTATLQWNPQDWLAEQEMIRKDIVNSGGTPRPRHLPSDLDIVPRRVPANRPSSTPLDSAAGIVHRSRSARAERAHQKGRYDETGDHASRRSSWTSRDQQPIRSWRESAGLPHFTAELNELGNTHDEWVTGEEIRGRGDLHSITSSRATMGRDTRHMATTTGVIELSPSVELAAAIGTIGAKKSVPADAKERLNVLTADTAKKTAAIVGARHIGSMTAHSWSQSVKDLGRRNPMTYHQRRIRALNTIEALRQPGSSLADVPPPVSGPANPVQRATLRNTERFDTIALSLRQ